MNPRTVAAINRLAMALDPDGLPPAISDDRGIVRLAEGTTIYRDDSDGRWVVASWSHRQAQYTGHSPAGRRAMGQAYCYTAGRTLKALRSLGVPSYATPLEALRAIERSLRAAAREFKF